MPVRLCSRYRTVPKTALSITEKNNNMSTLAMGQQQILSSQEDKFITQFIPPEKMIKSGTRNLKQYSGLLQLALHVGPLF